MFARDLLCQYCQLVLYLLLIPITDTVAKRYNQNLHPAAVHPESESYLLDYLLVAFSWRVTFIFLSSVILRITGYEKYVLGTEGICILICFDFGQILLGSFVRGRNATSLHQQNNNE